MTNYKIDMINNEPVAFYYNKGWAIDKARGWLYGDRGEVLIRAISLKSEILKELYLGVEITDHRDY